MTTNPLKRLSLSWDYQSILLAKPFTIARGTKTHADVLVLKISIGAHTGWSEAVPYARYNETIDSNIIILEQIQKDLATFSDNSLNSLVEKSHLYVQQKLAPSSAKNLLDCAFWDLKSKIMSTSVATLTNMQMLDKVISAQTLSVGNLQGMLKSATNMAHLPLIKIKLDANDVVEKMNAIHRVCPNTEFIIDANEAWSIDILKTVSPDLLNCNVVLIEQPLPAEQDQDLIGYNCPIRLCADESCHTSADITRLAGLYQMVNIKLDKSGGLTEALRLLATAKAANMGVMLGCMVASSLAMAPIYLLASQADYIDLDGPVLVAKDRDNGFKFTNGSMGKPNPFLWGNL